MVIPLFSFRINPDTVTLLKKASGEKQTAQAIRIAIYEYIKNEDQYLDIDSIGKNFVSPKTAAKILKTSATDVIQLAREGELKAVQLNGKGSMWLIDLDELKSKLFPTVIVRKTIIK